jgi:O-antigen/teichoic acid export membrane protein
MASATSQLKAGVLFSYLNSMITVIVSLLYTPYLLKMLGKGEYGLFSIAFSAIGLISIMNLGLGNTNVRYTARYLGSGDKQKEQAFHGMVLLIYLAMGLIVLIFGSLLLNNISLIFSENMTSNEIARLKTMFIIVLVSMSISLPLSVFGFIIKGYERFVFAKFTEFLRIILMPAAAVLLLYFGYKAIGLIAVIAIINVLILLANMIYCLFYLKVKFNFHQFNLGFLKEVIGFSFYVFLGVLAYRINLNSNQFVLGIVSGPLQVAVYALAFNLVINFRLLATSIADVFLPAISRIPDDENSLQRYNGYFIATGRLQFYVLAMFVLGFVFFGRPFIQLWVGKEYVHSFPIALMLLITMMFYLIQSVGISILQSQNKHKFSSIVFLVMSLFSILLSVFLSKIYGALGSAIALSVSWLIGNVLVMNIYYQYKIGLDIRRFWIQILRIAPAFLPAVFFGLIYCYLINVDSWMNLAFGTFGFALIYLFSVLKFSFNQFERQTILDPALKLIGRYFKK